MRESLELRKAVAEAVGWEWRRDPYGGEVWTGEERTSWTQFLPDRDWNHAIKACEAARVCHIELFVYGVPRCRVSVKIGAEPFDRIEVFDSDGHSPESLCRALLKALEAKDATD